MYKQQQEINNVDAFHFMQRANESHYPCGLRENYETKNNNPKLKNTYAVQTFHSTKSCNM